MKPIGIDDWAYKKGLSYGTIIINQETGRPIDLLPTRECEDVLAIHVANPECGVNKETGECGVSYLLSEKIISFSVILQNLREISSTFRNNQKEYIWQSQFSIVEKKNLSINNWIMSTKLTKNRLAPEYAVCFNDYRLIIRFSPSQTYWHVCYYDTC